MASAAGPAPRVRPATADDAGAVARLLALLGYPCAREEAAERIAVIAADLRS